MMTSCNAVDKAPEPAVPGGLTSFKPAPITISAGVEDDQLVWLVKTLED
jgi:hypothetical protein